MKKSIFFILFSVFLCVLLTAQSADSVTRMLDAKTVTFDEVAYFAVTYLNSGKEEPDFENAAAELKASLTFPKLKNSGSALNFKDFAYVCTRVWNLKGGLNYRLFQSPRYALRELKALRFVPPFTDPDAYVSGRDMLYIMSRCARAAEERNNKEAPQ
ncbi:hypothetical protein V1L52_02250 [Treponema sp. HNW]|uniref:hypothetical protein n=1 Tax=Treponema sp. HNW TaxID=3116654 RepID=UPI003D11F390